MHVDRTAGLVVGRIVVLLIIALLVCVLVWMGQNVYAVMAGVGSVGLAASATARRIVPDRGGESRGELSDS
ncbi:hypothetical protein ACFO4E_13180 [Nocardiopsis mangrovi]|uniref:Uncharacterized protein n=1 Tax=Nocardiopsis mangrovi TaxID=1179818 RepID=A0ABV9DZQ3_9ACTN